MLDEYGFVGGEKSHSHAGVAAEGGRRVGTLRHAILVFNKNIIWHRKCKTKQIDWRAKSEANGSNLGSSTTVA